MGEELKNNIRGFGEVLSAIITVISWLFDIQGIVPQLDWKIFTLVGFLLFICLITWHIVSLNNELNERIPNIDLIEDPIYINDVRMQSKYQTSTGSLSLLEAISCMAHIAFSNNPKYCTDKNSPDKIRAEISFYNKNNKRILGPLQGRWVETDEPPEIRKGKKRILESIDFPNNGAIRSLDLFLKYPEDEYCYGYNNDSYNYVILQNPAFIIKEKHFFVVVQLKGAYLRTKTWKFEVKTKGINDTFQIRYNEGWKKKQSE